MWGLYPSKHGKLKASTVTLGASSFRKKDQLTRPIKVTMSYLPGLEGIGLGGRIGGLVGWIGGTGLRVGLMGGMNVSRNVKSTMHTSERKIQKLSNNANKLFTIIIAVVVTIDKK